MTVLEILGYTGSLVNDVAAVLALVGSLILLLGSFGKASMKKYGQIAEWSILGLVLGWGFQICMAVTGTMPERIGMVFPMHPLMVYALLSVSALMLIGRAVIRYILRNPR